MPETVPVPFPPVSRVALDRAEHDLEDTRRIFRNPYGGETEREAAFETLISAVAQLHLAVSALALEVDLAKLPVDAVGRHHV